MTQAGGPRRKERRGIEGGAALRERRGDYLGKTVQVIPHVTNEIKAGVRKVWLRRKRTNRMLPELST